MFAASDLRLRLYNIEMTRRVAERRTAVPRRKRRPNHSINIPARPPPHICRVTTDRAQSPFHSIPSKQIYTERYTSQGLSFVRSSFSNPSPQQPTVPQSMRSPPRTSTPIHPRLPHHAPEPRAEQHSQRQWRYSSPAQRNREARAPPDSSPGRQRHGWPTRRRAE